ncbi:MAG: hypothetical protein H6722_07540 [Sandaracinus sp.]|nr:hypothetical protein [Sandaracinus sp.]MCB9621024.1 hypothetical protein [Sandaracinus sp.]
MTRARGVLAALIGVVLVASVSLVAAQENDARSALPWGDVAPRIEGDRVRVAALGLVDERIGSWPARRASARRRGEERARALLATWLDGHLRGESPSVAARAQAAARDAGEVVAVRALADGSAVVVMKVELSQLRAPFDEGRAPF